jgi:hypothetical protein
MNNEILVYTENDDPRTRYIIETLFVDFQGFIINYSSDLPFFVDFSGPKFSYLNKGIEHIPNIFNNGDLETDRIFNANVTLSEELNHNDLHFPIDLLSESFFLLSRAEEYFSHQRDKHGRFPASASLINKKKTPEKPFADIYSAALSAWIQTHFPDLKPTPKLSSELLSFDIDIAWALKNKPFIRQTGAIARDIVSGYFQKFLQRMNVMRGKIKDPFDVYDDMEALAQKTSIPMIFFFQVCSKGKYDKAVNVKSREFSVLVKRISEFAIIGIHPSYSGGQNADKIIAEKKILEDITGKPVKHSRHHFLKLNIPQTARVLCEAGISDDYTMGFADAPGWRAGTCKPFRIFDIEQNITLPLTTHPITIMDGTLGEYLKLNHDQAFERIAQLYSITQQYMGEFIPLWHNETLSNTGKWKGWKHRVFDPMIQLISSNNIIQQ